LDGLDSSLFLVATFLGGVTSGLAGFAMGLVVSRLIVPMSALTADAPH
jgi:hypothetical protein